MKRHATITSIFTRLGLGMLAVVMMSGTVTPVYAQAEVYDEIFWNQNEPIFYDPRDFACGTAATSLTGDSVEAKVWNYFVEKGLTAEQIAGVMGNIEAESGGIRTDAVESNGVGYGLVQWSFGRRAALEQAAADAGVSPAELSFQLDYIYYELTNRPISRSEYSGLGSTEWEGLIKQTTVEDALVFFHHEYEISYLIIHPNPRQAVIDARGGFDHPEFLMPNGLRGAAWFFNEFGKAGLGNPSDGCAVQSGGEFVHPIADGTRVNEGYGGPRSFGSVICGGVIWHNGYDFDGQENTTPIVAAHAGTVTVTNDYNNAVYVTHADGFQTRYLHMNHGAVSVENGQTVKAGDQLGFLGNTGYSSGPHLHFEVEVSGNTNPKVAEMPVGPCTFGKFVNPEVFMSAHGVSICPNGGCDLARTQ